MSYKVVGTLSEVNLLRKLEPQLKLHEVEFVLQGRHFMRWYMKNESILLKGLSAGVPAAAVAMFGVDLLNTAMLMSKGVSIKAAVGGAIPAMAAASNFGPAFGFLNGPGGILLHFLGIGFLTLVIMTYLKLTGRGDLAPMVMFVSGIAILIEVIVLFKSLYTEVSTLLQM